MKKLSLLLLPATLMLLNLPAHAQATATTVPAQLEQAASLPTLRIVSNGAPAILTGGDQTDYGFHAEVSGLGPGSTLGRYSWQAPDWTIVADGESVPGLIPDGRHGTTLRVTVPCTYGGRTTVLSATLPVAYQEYVATPTLATTLTPAPSGELPTLSGAALFTATAPGAAAYYWTTTGDVYIRGAQGNLLTATYSPYNAVTVVAGNGSGVGSVRVVATNTDFNCPDSAPATYQLAYGRPPVAAPVTRRSRRLHLPPVLPTPSRSTASTN